MAVCGSEVSGSAHLDGVEGHDETPTEKYIEAAGAHLNDEGGDFVKIKNSGVISVSKTMLQIPGNHLLQGRE